MMFILNFEYVVDEESDNSTEKISQTSPTKSDQSEYLKGSLSPHYANPKKQWTELLFSPHAPVFLHTWTRKASATPLDVLPSAQPSL